MSNKETKTINPNPPADFQPDRQPFTPLRPFRFWCQKVLPLVYDDSLSYYELLCKVVDYLNKTMEDVENLNTDTTSLYNSYERLQGYVNNYFSSLDVQTEINNKLDDMSSDGTLSKLIQPLFDEYKQQIDPVVTLAKEEANNALLTANAANATANSANATANSAKQTADLTDSRLDNLIVDGTPTEGNAELIDGRIGYDGTVYDNIGNAIRGQVTELKSDLDSYGRSGNVIHRIALNNDIFADALTIDYAIKYTSVFNNGGYKTVPLLIRLDYIPHVVKKVKISADVIGAKKCNSKFGYSSNNIVESGFDDIVNRKLNVEINYNSDTSYGYGVIYLFFTVLNDIGAIDVNNIVIKIDDYKCEMHDESITFAGGTVSKTETKYNSIASNILSNNPNLKDKKWLVYGDSISDDDFFDTHSHYYDVISENTGVNVEAYAVGGSGYIIDSTVADRVSKYGPINNINHQIDNYGSSADIVTIFGGTNDWSKNVTLGDVRDGTEAFANTTTFCGAVGLAIRKVKTKYPYATIIVNTILPRFDVSDYAYSKINGNGDSIEDFNNAIRNVAKMYSVPVLDMYNVSQLYKPSEQPNYWYDNLHPSKLYQTTVFSKLVYQILKENVC